MADVLDMLNWSSKIDSSSAANAVARRILPCRGSIATSRKDNPLHQQLAMRRPLAMHAHRKRLAGFALILTLGLGLAGPSALDGQDAAPAFSTVVPPLVKFNGVMALPGTPNRASDSVSMGMVTAVFSLYEMPEGGTPLWSETQKVQLDEKGRYAVVLGATLPAGLPLDLFTSGKALWLGVQPQLSGVGELPRVLLFAVPYALKASDSDTLGGKPASAYALAGAPAVMESGGPTGLAAANPAPLGIHLGRGAGSTTSTPPATNCPPVTGNSSAMANMEAKTATTCTVVEPLTATSTTASEAANISLSNLTSPTAIAQSSLNFAGAGGLAAGGSNSSLIFSPSGKGLSIVNSLADKGGQWFNVKAYGATGNGTTDDSAAIMSAEAAAKAAGGGTIFFPPGTYAVGSTLAFTNVSGLVIQGSGISNGGASPVSTTSTLLWTGGNNGILILGGGLQYTTFRDLSLSAGAHSGVTLYYGTGNPTYDVSTQVTFEHVRFSLPTTSGAGGIGAVLGSMTSTPARDQVDLQRFIDCDFWYGNTGVGVQLRSINGLLELFQGDSFHGLAGSSAYGIDFIAGGFASYQSITLGNHVGVHLEDVPGYGCTNVALIGGHSEADDYAIDSINPSNIPGNGGCNLTVSDYFVYSASTNIAFNFLSTWWVYNLLNDYIYTNANIVVPQGVGRVVNAIGTEFLGSGTAGHFETPDTTQVAPTFGNINGATYQAGYNVLNSYNGNLVSNIISLQMNSESYQPASTGFIRMKNADAINFQNGTNNATVNGLSMSASNVAMVGGPAGVSFAGPIANGATATTQTTGDTSARLATDDFVAKALGTVVANSTITVAAATFTANSCSASATAITMKGVTTGTTFTLTPRSDISAVAGWGASGGLEIAAWPTSNTLNYRVCNPTGSNITTSSSVIFNVSAR